MFGVSLSNVNNMLIQILLIDFQFINFIYICQDIINCLSELDILGSIEIVRLGRLLYLCGMLDIFQNSI